MRDYLEAVRRCVVVFDGGMGATLEQFDLTEADYGGLEGKCHEALVLNRPDVVEGVHASMLDAGAEVVETDTFQASRLKLDEWGLGGRTAEINRRAAEIARAAAGEHRFVAGSIGPTGFLPASDDPALGAIGFERLRGVFAEQAEGLIRGGVDLIMIETAQDILEVKAAVFGSRDAMRAAGRTVPIQASVSLLAESGRMLLGTDVSAVLAILAGLRVDALGLNCSTGPQDMRDAIRYLGERAPVPVHCMPNAGIPEQGPDGETIFPERPEPFANALGDFVRRYGVGIVGGCCGTTPAHIAALAETVRGLAPGPRPAGADAARVSSMMSARSLRQEPPPTLTGERVNAQGSRKAKRLLLAEDYEGLAGIAESQVEGGAHVIDLCVAVTERQDEAEQMSRLVKEVALRVDAPIQIDSTEPDVIRAGLEQAPGRSVVNSANLEAGREKLDRVASLCLDHGAALVALTIDEEGMARTAERKLEVARRIHSIVCEEHGLDPRLLMFDPLTFTLATGEAEWRESAVETFEGIRLIHAEIPGVLTSLGVSNVSFGLKPRARAVVNSVFLHHAVKAGLDIAMVNPKEITPYEEIDPSERALADALVLCRSDDALERLVDHFEAAGSAAVPAEADPTAGMEPEEALRWHILRRKRDGVEEWVDRSVEKIGAVPTLNDALLPAMKEVGDKFGSGELILPFVLQSAEVMKRAVARLERYLDRVEGHTKGTVVLATVFGDVHDIGKSLVNTILTNNGFTVVDLGKQVPVSRVIEAAAEHRATAIGLSALLVSTSKQMPMCVSELHERGHGFPVLVGGAAVNRDFARRILYPKGKESDAVYEPGVFYCKDAFQALDRMEALADGERGPELLDRTKREASEFRRGGRGAGGGDTADSSVRSAVSPDNPVPAPPFLGAREIAVDVDAVFDLLDTHVLFKLHWGGKGVSGDEWQRLVDRDFRPRLERMWREADYLAPRAVYGYFPANSDGNALVIFDPDDPATERARLAFPRQPAHDRLCLADYWRPIESGERDVVAFQAVTGGPGATALCRRLESEGEYSEQLFVHGLSVQAAEGVAEWLHSRIRGELGIASDQGRRYSWGYPACPDTEHHVAVFDLLDAKRIGLELTAGHAIEPEQSTVAIVAHHPQATYFGMRSGFVPAAGGTTRIASRTGS